MGDADGWVAATGNKEGGEVPAKKEDRVAALSPATPRSVKEQQTAPRSFGPLVIKILCAAAQLGLGSSPDFNGTKKH